MKITSFGEPSLTNSHPQPRLLEVFSLNVCRAPLCLPCRAVMGGFLTCFRHRHTSLSMFPVPGMVPGLWYAHDKYLSNESNPVTVLLKAHGRPK